MKKTALVSILSVLAASLFVGQQATASQKTFVIPVEQTVFLDYAGEIKMLFASLDLTSSACSGQAVLEITANEKTEKISLCKKEKKTTGDGRIEIELAEYNTDKWGKFLVSIKNDEMPTADNPASIKIEPVISQNQSQIEKENNNKGDNSDQKHENESENEENENIEIENDEEFFEENSFPAKISEEIKNRITKKNGSIYLNDKEVKIMPNTASEKAIETLSLKKEVEIELKDTGKPVYEISGEKEVEILGLIKSNMKIKTQIDAETGEIEKTKYPWWKFLAW